MKRAKRALVLLLVLASCEDSSAPVERGTAELLGTISRELPAVDADKARLALVQDAWRREQRFRDAVDPGHLFRATRVEQDEIDHGLWSNDELYQLGGQLFTLEHTPAHGFGGGDGPTLRRFHLGIRGGPDAYACTSCHWRGGLAGAGDAADNAMLRGDGLHQSTTLARNPPALAGIGVREHLAVQMNAELARVRDEAIAAAKGGLAQRVKLESRGVGFGWITVRADGSVDTKEIEGIDHDLVIKPFGRKGTLASIRDAAEDALLVHHGMQSTYLVEHAGEDRMGVEGGVDPDGDRIADEIVEGQVTALVAFLAMLEVPQEEVPGGDPYFATLWARGRLDFDTLGCATCHVPSLAMDDTAYALPHRDGGPALAIDLATDAAPPQIAAGDDGTLRVRMYSDLKRHRMGDALAEPRGHDGAAADEYITPPLWGIARSRPYLHDGRAPTLEDAILLHGGEAQASRDAYAALDDAGRGPLRVFLTSLVRATRLVTP
jgi:hypothetical protein